MQDHSGKNYQDNSGVTVDVYDMGINDPDSAKALAWQGTLRYTEGPEGLPVGDGLRSFWAGHAWGQVGDGAAAADVDFLEMGYEMTPYQEYFANKGKNYFNAGDVVGIAAFLETPVDDWGVDLTSRGQVTIPEAMYERPNAFTFDGDSADWADVPMGIRWVNNQDGWYPVEVGAAISDPVNVRNVKVVAHENEMYFFMRVWGAPAWPNNLDAKSQGDSTYYRSRGYFHLLLDVDNNPATGWNTDWYETHYTPVGYLRSQGQQYDVIGSETYVYLGETYRTSYDGGGVQDIGYGAQDHSGKNYQDNSGVTIDLYDVGITDPDSSLGMQHDGMLVGEPNETIYPGLADGKPLFFAHAWGVDFLEAGFDLRPHKAYWSTAKAADIFKAGDVIGFAAFFETPVDDWGVDMTARGETSVVSGIWNDKEAIVADKYVLENNYPNPFNPTTTINFQTPKASDVTMLIYNTLGQKVKTLVNENMPIGKHTVVWDGRNDAGQMLPTGMYFYTLKAGSTSLTKKMLLVK
jgi:hypothetical protein